MLISDVERRVIQLKQITNYIFNSSSMKLLRNISLLYHNGEIEDSEKNELTQFVASKNYSHLRKNLNQLIPISGNPELIDEMLAIINKQKEDVI